MILLNYEKPDANLLPLVVEVLPIVEVVGLKRTIVLKSLHVCCQPNTDNQDLNCARSRSGVVLGAPWGVVHKKKYLLKNL